MCVCEYTSPLQPVEQSSALVHYVVFYRHFIYRTKYFYYTVKGFNRNGSL